ncbi:MAG: two-component system response regulator [Magnetococcales bacterium]|nr:two-component system response regulator [Magnetococcales bacterium]
MTMTTKRYRILIVDDVPGNLEALAVVLSPDYELSIATNGLDALQLAHEALPDLILLDVVMPDMDGYAVCRHLKADPATRDIPVIFLTARSEEEDEQQGLQLGAADYISKPIGPAVVVARVSNQIALKISADRLRERNESLESEVAQRTRELVDIQDVTILAMASLAETRDSDTGYHIRRTQHYVKVLSLHLRSHPRFAEFLNDHNIDMLFRSAPLHDIGKVGIPDRILLKPGRFEPDEFEIMKTHTTLGRAAMVHAEQTLNTSVDFLTMAKEIAYYHHERIDGTGYPEGIAGDAIPLSARLMSVADVYDALVSRRAYKLGMPHAQAVQIIAKGKGSQFDADIVDAFLMLQQEFDSIAHRYQDSDTDMQRKATYRSQALPE